MFQTRPDVDICFFREARGVSVLSPGTWKHMAWRVWEKHSHGPGSGSVVKSEAQ